jgi:Fe-S-cluster-containing dehydrogenase component/CRP-like cAMP-binding protein
MTAAVASHDAWPAAVWSATILRGLDDVARAAIALAGRVVNREAGATIYRDGDASESFFVIESGAVELRAIRRGDEVATVVRTARVGDAFGEEALLPGIPRYVTATALEPGRVVEIPIAVFQRVVGRLGTATREQRYLERAAARDMLACGAFARELRGDDVELLLDAARLERIGRGTRIYEPGAPADRVYFVLDGLVQLQRDDAVCAYLARGDFFGDQDALAGGVRRHAAVANGDTWCAIVPRDALRTLADRNPGLLPRLRRVAEQHEATQGAVIDAASARSTQHVFRDLYRMQMARSLLVIDQDSCVRCGHCAWSCEQLHGTSRLVRRGDKVIAKLAGASAGPATLLLPNTCQHCRHAACMIDCPTGAIGRDPEGEVFIRPSLCTGCGNCAKACPWENIQMAPGAAGRDVAVKCDLCRGFDAPACVEACPTGAVLRLDPARDVAEVAQVLGPAPGATPRRRAGFAFVGWLAAGIAIAAGGLAVAAHRAYAWAPGRGIGLAAGIVAALVVVGLAAYVVPKRRVRGRRRDPAARLVGETRPAPRSRTRLHLWMHLALGAVVPAAALAHGGTALHATTGGALAAALAIAVALGAFAAVAYRAVPRALTRLERRGALPEDLDAERDALEARLYREVSGASDRVKAVVDRLLLPYARARLGALALVASGRSLADEEQRLQQRLADALAGKQLDVVPLIRIAVELRALPARRALAALVRIWPPLHAIAGAVTLALLALHVVLR